MVPVVPAKPASTAKAPPSTAGWLAGALSEPKRGGRGDGWSRGGGLGGGFRGPAAGAVVAVAAVAAATRLKSHSSFVFFFIFYLLDLNSFLGTVP